MIPITRSTVPFNLNPRVYKTILNPVHRIHSFRNRIIRRRTKQSTAAHRRLSESPEYIRMHAVQSTIQAHNLFFKQHSQSQKRGS
jgi:hypothetical protein